MSAAPALITPVSLLTSRWRFCGHINAGRFHYLNKECVTFPGLSYSDAWDRKTRRTARTYFVAGDQAEFDTVEAAAKAWNDQRRAEAVGQTEAA